MGIFEFLQMPYGLCNALATFQRLMQNCLGELNLTYALIYLDDVIIFSRTEEEHLTQLRAVFERFREHGLKLKPSKCHFLWKEITFLGHKVSQEGMKLGDDGLRGIAEMAPPANYTEIRRFLGATRFFQRFIKNYTQIAKPLNDLLEGEASKWKTQLVDLPLEAKEAFDILKMKCMTALVLTFADFEKPFLLETDASSLGLGAVLSQKQDDGKFHLVAYASRELKGGEGKYHSSKLEFLALKWAVTNQFKEYLRYKPFTVRTDNNPLTYVMTTPNLDAIGHWWVATLAGYNMTIEYLKGANNKVVDILSWVPQWLDPEAVTVLLRWSVGWHRWYLAGAGSNGLLQKSRRCCGPDRCRDRYGVDCQRGWHCHRLYFYPLGGIGYNRFQDRSAGLWDRCNFCSFFTLVGIDWHV